MTSEYLETFLNQRPFEPFRVVLSSGEGFEVTDPENAKLVRGGLYVFYKTVPDEEFPDRVRMCSLLHIVAVDKLIPQL